MDSHIPLSVRGLSAALRARQEEEKRTLYICHLLYLLAGVHYSGVTEPGEFLFKRKVADSRSAGEIVSDLVQKLKGGG